MKPKPSWTLWLLMIVAPVAVFGGIRWHQRHFSATLANSLTIAPLDPEATRMAEQGLPLVGDNIQLNYLPDGYGNAEHEIEFCLYNPTRTNLLVNIVISSGASELGSFYGITPKSRKGVSILQYHNGSSILHDTFGNGVFYMGTAQINRKRKKTIFLRAYWKNGEESGAKIFVVTPQMNSQNTIF